MESDFSNAASFPEPSGWTPIENGTEGRYRFFKVRLYGQLHFVKTLSEAYASDLLSIEALRKEFVVGYNLNHPGIVRYLQFPGNAIYEEYVDGATLREMLSQDDARLQAPDFLAEICIQLLDAVEYMHGCGVLHLDLKPENVMVTRIGNRVKIIDFGCAYTADNDTTRGFTLQYRAPEQEHGDINGYTDIFLIGRIMEELAANARQQRSWKNFIKKSTEEDPDKRFRTENEARLAIPGKGQRRKAYLAASFAILIAIVAGASLYHRNYDAGDTARMENLVYGDTAMVTAPQETAPAVESQVLGKDVEAPQEEEKTRKVVSPTEMEDEIGRMIRNFVAEEFETNVRPDQPIDSLAVTNGLQFQTLVQSSIERSENFGDSLAKRYPDHEPFIRTNTYNAISAYLLLASDWYGYNP